MTDGKPPVNRTDRPTDATRRLMPQPAQALRLSFRRLAAGLFLGFCLVIAAGLWAYHGVKESTDDIAEGFLRSYLDIGVSAMRIWLQNEKAFVESWARNGRTVEVVERLASGRASGMTTESQQALAGELRQGLAPALADSDFIGFAVVSADGMVLAASRPEPYEGRRVRDSLLPHLERVVSGETVFRPPVHKGELVDPDPAGSTTPVIHVAAPIRGSDGSTPAALVFLLDPTAGFSRLLVGSRVLSVGGGIYVFNREGLMISESPHGEELRTIGLLPDTEEASAILEVALRDPGGDLRRKARPLAPREEWPLTRMAAEALEGRAGVDVDGYRDYRGVTVIGAWQWLPEFEFGMAVEIAKARLLRIMRPLLLTFLGLFGLLALLSAGLAASWFRIHRLKESAAQLRRVGPYTLVEKIGEGGMGRVYRAEHALLKRPCAVKLLKPDALTEDSLVRFEREVQMTSGLTHPNTVEIYDYGHTPDGRFYYAMEYLPGITLDQLIDLEGPVAPARTAHILRQVCDCLAEAHGAGLVHRDIKPPNIMVCARGGIYDMVKVLDFGLVKDVAAPDSEMTALHGVMGTPAYVAPERITDPGTNDSRSDVYSLGSVAFNLLTARDVFEGATAVEIGYHILKTPPPSPSERLGAPLPPDFERLVTDCLAKSPDDRPQSVEAIARSLDAMAGSLGAWGQDAARDWWRRNDERVRSLRKMAPG